MANKILSNLGERIRFFRFEILTVVVVPIAWFAILMNFGEGSSMFAIKSWLTMSAGSDSWMPLDRAVAQAASGQSIYGSLFFQEQIKFQYPPSSVIIFKWLNDLGAARAGLLNQLNWWLIWGNAVLVAVLGLALAKDAENEMVRKNWFVLGWLSLLTCLFSYPIMRGYALGQVQVWINLLFALACVCWHYRKKEFSGVAIGLICLIKPQFGLFIVWGLIARQWRFIAGWAAVFTPVTAVSLFHFGIDEHLDYLRVLSSLSQTGESFFANQSINGLINRLLENGPILTWEPNAFPPVNAFVRWATLISSIFIVGAVLIRQFKRRANLVDFQLAALAFTMASPIAWEHHYGIMPAMFVCGYFNLRALKSRFVIRRAGILLVLSFLLSQVSLVKWPGIDASPWNVLYSYNMFGAVLLFLLLFYSTELHYSSEGALVEAANR